MTRLNPSSALWHSEVACAFLTFFLLNKICENHMGFFCKSIFCSFVPLHTFKTLKHINVLILIILLNYVLEMTMFGFGYVLQSTAM